MKLPDHLIKKRNELIRKIWNETADGHPQAALKTGYNACYAEMQEREKKLVGTLKRYANGVITGDGYHGCEARTTLKELGIE